MAVYNFFNRSVDRRLFPRVQILLPTGDSKAALSPSFDEVIQLLFKTGGGSK